MMNKKNITLLNILKRFKLKVGFTLFMSLLESLIFIFFPLFIGFAINDLLKSEHSWLIYLGLLGFASLVVGAGRRFFDTRTYAYIYEEISTELVEEERKKEISVSITSARVGLLNEFVEFLENSFPEILTSFIGIIGTLFILFFLNKTIFFSCLFIVVLVIIIYGITSNKNLRFNKKYNDVLENQVEKISDKTFSIKTHFKNLMKWNKKLSDLETVNFSIIWFFMIVLLIFSIKITSENALEYGTIFSITMYVFDFIENSLTLPLYYQQLIRLSEISTRLNG
ncbi:MAG: ABC transporter six-transmembrane domain-containing protein [Anaerolineaceae bacterium]|nr:ABC transporter six-transmembrane domain-containing protein [Anaerolineaceae bacterium]